MSEPTQNLATELLERLRTDARPKLSVREAARRADMSEARWRQIVKGYKQEAGGVRVAVRAPADTLARMARVVGATADQLREAGRDDAADELIRLSARPRTDAELIYEVARLQDEIATREHLRRSNPEAWSSIDDRALDELRFRLESMAQERNAIVHQRRRSAEQQQTEKLVDLYLLTEPLSHPDLLDPDDLLDAAVELTQAVEAYTVKAVGGYSRMQELVEARRAELDQLHGQDNILDLIERMEEQDNGVETATQSDASTEGSQAQEAGRLKQSDHDLAARDVGYVSEGRRIREKQDREAEDPA